MKDPVVLITYNSNMLGILGKWIDFPYVLQSYIQKNPSKFQELLKTWKKMHFNKKYVTGTLVVWTSDVRKISSHK